MTRLAVGGRYLGLVATLVAAAGAVGHWLAWPLLVSSIGPTAYMFAAHPASENARFRNALVGHAVAVGVGLGALAAFGLWRHPSVSTTGSPTFPQVAAAALAAGATVLILELVGTHHAPAAATALLVATGLAKPGPPLVGLVLGLAVVIVLGPVLGRIPVTRSVSAYEALPETTEAHQA